MEISCNLVEVVNIVEILPYKLRYSVYIIVLMEAWFLAILTSFEDKNLFGNTRNNKLTYIV